MTDFSTDARILFIDVGVCDKNGAICVAPSDNSKERLEKFLQRPLPVNARPAILAAGENGLSGQTSHMDFDIDGPTFIVFSTLHKNWSFNRQCPVEICGGLNNNDTQAKLIQISGSDDCFILYYDCEFAFHQKYSLFVDVKNGKGPNAPVTKLIIDPGGNGGPGNRP